MAQAGWYADPAGGEGCRWWDGNAWTGDTRMPEVSAVAVEPVVPTPSGLVVRGEPFGDRGEVYADSDRIALGADSIRWAEVEWFGYSGTNDFVQHTAYGINLGRPIGQGSSFFITVGRGAYRKARGVAKGQEIQLLFHGPTEMAVDETWGGLVELAVRELQPRLLADILARVRAGQRVDIAGEYIVDAQGFEHPRQRRSFRWSDFEIHRVGRSIRLQPVGKSERKGLLMDLLLPNVVLIPLLQAELSGR